VLWPTKCIRRTSILKVGSSFGDQRRQRRVMGQYTLLCECGVNKVRPSFRCSESTPLPLEWGCQHKVPDAAPAGLDVPVADAAGVVRLTLSVFDGSCVMSSPSRRPMVFLNCCSRCYLLTQRKRSACLYLTRCRTLAKADPLLSCLAIESAKAEVLHRLWVWMIQDVVGG